MMKNKQEKWDRVTATQSIIIDPPTSVKVFASVDNLTFNVILTFSNLFWMMALNTALTAQRAVCTRAHTLHRHHNRSEFMDK